MSASSSPSQYRSVGVILAIGSGLLIGSSFVFKKKGLLSSQKGHVAGEGVAYLKSPMWWTGMIIMILGELCNFAAYAFVEAIIVTPMGALSVVISALLSHWILGEKLSLFGWISCVQCLLGASILALNGPQEQSVTTIVAFKHLFLKPWFLAYGGVVIAAALVLAFFVAPRWGHKSMLPYLGVCSLIGGLSVSCTQGLGACILTSIRGENQFKNWFIYFLLIFVVITLLTEIYYLNVALALFNTAMVTPTYYVTFTFCTLVTSVILYQGLKASATQIITVVLAFAVICTGIFILQMSKVDPRQLTNVDERTTLLLEAARAEVDPHAARSLELQRTSTLRSRRSARTATTRVGSTMLTPAQSPQVFSVNGHTDTAHIPPLSLSPSTTRAMTHDIDLEADQDRETIEFDENRAIVEKTEEPGLDSLRGFAGAIGTIIRIRRRAREFSHASQTRSRTSENGSIPSQEMLRSVSTNGSPGRPTGWLRGMWSSPRGSRLRSLNEVEGGEIENPSTQILEVSEKGPTLESPPEIEIVTPRSSHSLTTSVTSGPFPPSLTSGSQAASPSPLRSVTSDAAMTVTRTSSVRFAPTRDRSKSAPPVPGSPQPDSIDTITKNDPS